MKIKLRTILIMIIFSTAMSAKEEAKLTFVIGNVQVLQNKKWKKAKIGMSLKPNSQIKTGKRSKAQISFKKNKIRISPNSHLKNIHFSSNNKNYVFLNKGFIWSKIQKGSMKRFRVKTPTSVAGIRGTSFAINYSKKKTLLCVCSGKVELKTKKLKTIVSKGQGKDSSHKEIAEYKTMFHKGIANEKFMALVKKDIRYKNCLSCHKKKKVNVESHKKLKKIEEEEDDFDY